MAALRASPYRQVRVQLLRIGVPWSESARMTITEMMAVRAEYIDQQRPSDG